MHNFFSSFAGAIHAENAHWWTNPSTGERVDRNKCQTLFLINSEISEAGEGERKDLMDPHIPYRRNAEVELADAMIRLMDYVGAHKYNIDQHLFLTWPSLNPAQNNFAGLTSFFTQRFYQINGNVGEQLLQMQMAVCRIADLEGLTVPNPRAVESGITWLIALIFDYCGCKGYDLEGAIRDKRAYNRVRADHSNKARLAAGGKKW